jgi:hypothetical protein
VRELGPAEWTGDRNQSRLATLVKLAGSAQRVAGSARSWGGAREPGSSARREGGCKLNAVEPDGRPKKIALIADGFNSFQPTVGQKRSVTVKAMGFYGNNHTTKACQAYARRVQRGATVHTSTVVAISIRSSNFGWTHPNRVVSQAVFQKVAAGHPKFGAEREVRSSTWESSALIASRLDAPRIPNNPFFPHTKNFQKSWGRLEEGFPLV